MPDKILFSESECRRQVAPYKSDKTTLIRVCGHKDGVCTRSHVGANLFSIGVYQTVAGGGNTFIDGIAGTCITIEAHEAELRSEAADRGWSIVEAGMSLAMGTLDGEDIQASGSEESDYRKAQGADVKPIGTKAKALLVSPTARTKSPRPMGARFPTPPAKTKTVGVELGMQKTAQGGLKQAPGSVPIKVKPTPFVKPELKPDPMVMALQQLTVAFGSMDQQFKGMNQSLQELQHRAHEQEGKLERELLVMKKVALSSKTTTPMHMNPGGTGPFYAVASGLNGHQGVYNSWSECAAWVAGVPGNVFQTFASLQGAHDASLQGAREFIDQYNVGQMSRRNQLAGGGNLFQEGPESGSDKPLSGPESEDHGASSFGRFLDQRESKAHEERPDFKFLGLDPSTKKEEELYGQDTTAEGDLVDFMTPKGMDSGIKKGICQAATDVVALQGGYLNSIPDSEDGLALFTQSITEMAHGGKADVEVFGRPDYNWRAGARTGIKGLTSDEKLRRQIKLLIKLGPKIQYQMTKWMTNALKRVGWTDDNAISACAQGGPLYRMISNTVDYYLSLHQHFMGLSTSSVDWNYVQTEINHHSEEMTLIRSVSHSRIQALVHLYCYLRDGHQSSWHSASLQAIRNEELFNRGVVEYCGDASGTQAGMTLCSKCGTTIHGGGLKACPWANLS
jgi:hypothetical protein